MLVIVTGLPATGKSTFAARLSDALALPLLAKDAAKEPLLAALQVRDATRSRHLSDASFALLFSVAAAHLAAGRGVVLEGNFRPGEHERDLAGLCAAAAATGQVLCELPESARRTRLAARAADPSRHPGHRDIDVLAAAPAAASPSAGPLAVGGPLWRLAGDAPGGAAASLLAAIAAWRGDLATLR